VYPTEQVPGHGDHPTEALDCWSSRRMDLRKRAAIDMREREAQQPAEADRIWEARAPELGRVGVWAMAPWLRAASARIG
jgi:hypothetical protein